MKQKLQILSILILSTFIAGCSSLNLNVHSTDNTMVKKYSITMAHYAMDNKKIFMRLAGKVSPSYFRTDTGQRFQIYLVAHYHEQEGLSNVKAYSISHNSLMQTRLNDGKAVALKIKLEKNKLSASLKQKMKYKEGFLFFDFSNIEMKKVDYRSLLAMEINYDESCVLNKSFSSYTKNQTVGKGCPKDDVRYIIESQN